MSEHFFIIGAQRSGTTYLYAALDSHPEIEMAKPVRPEPKYFLNTATEEISIEAYRQAYFSGKPGAWLLGEKSTSYLESETAAQRIAAAFPAAKLIIMLRDPVARAVSNYYFSVENGLETAPIEEAFFQEEERVRSAVSATSVSPYAYLSRGRYIDYIDMYARHFARDQLIILLHEQFLGSAAAYGDLCARLGVATNHVPPSLDQRINATTLVREPLPPAEEQYARDYFATPNRRLAEAYGLDLGCWAMGKKASPAG